MIRQTGNQFNGDDRRVAPYSNLEEDLLKAIVEIKKQQLSQDPPTLEEKKPFSMSFVWQIITTIGGMILMGAGLYQSSHDDQLTMRNDFKNFQERYKEDQERHNSTHAKIFEEVKDLSIQTKSIEDYVTQFMSSRGKK